MRGALQKSMTGLVAAILIAGFAPAAALAIEPVFSAGGVAIHGYDPVAYFTEGKAVEGKAEFQTQWNGALWRFASAAHRDAFQAAPAKYAPQFGGYCAYAVSQGSTASTVPEAWTVVGDKLYLNKSTGVRSLWSRDVPGNIAKAESNWPRIAGQR